MNDDKGSTEPPQGTASPDADEERASQAESWGRQITGAIIGALVALVLASIGMRLGLIGGDLARYALWGGVVGGLVGASEALARAGSRLTHSDSTWLNILVGIAGMIVVAIVLWALALLGGRLLRGLGLPR